MSRPAAEVASEHDSLVERYVHAVTRRLPEEQRVDVADELRASLEDRVAALLGEQAGMSHRTAEEAALVELGDPEVLAAGYTGRRLQLIGPELFPAYERTLKVVLATAVPATTIVLGVLDVMSGSSATAVLGGTAWLVLTLVVHICFWTTLVFAVAERGGDVAGLDSCWTPERLPEVPRARGSLSETVGNVAILVLFGAALVGQHVASVVPAGRDDVPLLDPDLWSFWLPLLLTALVAEAVFEVVRYRAGGWSPRLAVVHLVLGGVTTAVLVFLALSDRLLNPAAVAALQEEWAGFDADVANSVVAVVAVLVWAWESFDGWRKARQA